MPSSKLREVTSGSTRNGTSRRSVNVFTENPIMTGPRTSRPRKKLVEVDTSDEDLEDQEEDEVDDEDAPGEDDEDVDADGDLDMDDTPPQPPVSKRHTKSSGVPASTSRAVKGVEAKEMELDAEDEEDDEELSEPDSDAEGEPDDQEESGLGNVNGGEDDLDEEEEEEELDSDDGTPTADPARMTKRQRGTLGNDFLQLPMEPQVKKHLTAEERAMRRAEMARRRKNLSEKRNEEEKMDTINRLLRKQAPKRRGRIPAAEAAETASAEQETLNFERPDPTMVRWVSGRKGSKIYVSEEWLETPAGRVFGNPSLKGSGPRKLVEEV
ncbi:PAPA-1-like conserved region-domain-containing protein [Aspergillus alliaceus]|nr:PAPA-1-like conserved region-domain-containing protein [Aspergillus alliaceus]